MPAYSHRFEKVAGLRETLVYQIENVSEQRVRNKELNRSGYKKRAG